MRKALSMSAAIILALCAGTGSAEAAPKLRVQVEQKGDFLLIGNTIGYECGNMPVTPIVGNANCFGSLFNTDTAPDIFWRDGNASISIILTDARTSAQLAIPAGANVTHAYLYWGATRGGPGADANVTLNAPGGFTGNITATESYQSTNNAY